MSQQPQQPQQSADKRQANNGRPKTAPSKFNGNQQQGSWAGKRKPFNKAKQNNRQNGKGQAPPSTTVFVNRVFLDDLEENQNETMARHLKEQRVRLIKDVMAKFGEITAFEHNEGENAIYATYATRDQVNAALDNLKKEEKAKAVLDALKAQHKFPASLYPNLPKYKFGIFRPRENTGPKNAFKQQGEKTTYRNVIAHAKDQQPQPAAQAAPAVAQAPVAEAPVEKKKKEKRAKVPAQAAPVPAPVAPSPVQTEQQRRQATADLMREAEIAKYKNDLQFFNKQQAAVRSELEAEKERVKDRDARIASLSQELERVNNEKLRIETQLSAEQNWKKKGQESIQKLEDERTHLHEQAQTVEFHLKQLSSGVSGF